MIEDGGLDSLGRVRRRAVRDDHGSQWVARQMAGGIRVRRQRRAKPDIDQAELDTWWAQAAVIAK